MLVGITEKSIKANLKCVLIPMSLELSVVATVPTKKDKNYNLH